MGKILARIALAAAICLPVMARAAPVAVENGNFITSPGPGSFTSYSAPSTAITDWTVSQGSVDLIGTYWQAPLGGNSVDLDGTSAGAIQGTIDNTTLGQKYLLTFYLAGNPDAQDTQGNPLTKTVQVVVGGGSQTFQFTVGPSNNENNMGWKPESMVITGTAGTTTISFTSLDPAGNSWGPVIANVSVPEPSMALMLGSGLLGFFGIRRRFAK